MLAGYLARGTYCLAAWANCCKVNVQMGKLRLRGTKRPVGGHGTAQGQPDSNPGPADSKASA